MFKKLLVVATIAAGLMSTQASAAFVFTDWKTTGDKLSTLDTKTGLEWLDLSRTYGKTFNQVVSQLSTTYAGWRLPTESEVSQLMLNFYGTRGLTAVGWSSRNVITSTVARNAEIYFRFGSNTTTRVSDSMVTIGNYLDDNGNLRAAGSALSSAGTTYTILYGMAATGTYSRDSVVTTTGWNFRQHDNAHGVWLVSDGGTTLSSINNPTLNINNPNAPINTPVTIEPVNPTDVTVPAGIAAAGMLMLMFGSRRKVA